jgi:ribosomal protein S6
MENTQYYVSKIANPIVTENLEKKILRLTKKSISFPNKLSAVLLKNAKRGVKEVVKGIRKGQKGYYFQLIA